VWQTKGRSGGVSGTLTGGLGGIPLGKHPGRGDIPHSVSGTNMGTLLPAIAGDTRGLFKLEKKELNFKI